MAAKYIKYSGISELSGERYNCEFWRDASANNLFDLSVNTSSTICSMKFLTNNPKEVAEGNAK